MLPNQTEISNALPGIVTDATADGRVRVDAARLLLSMCSSRYATR